MTWSPLHSNLLGRTFEKILGRPDFGTMAFVLYDATGEAKYLKVAQGALQFAQQLV